MLVASLNDDIDWVTVSMRRAAVIAVIEEGKCVMGALVRDPGARLR